MVMEVIKLMELNPKELKIAATPFGDLSNEDDRLSNLPEPILHYILSFLQTIDVVRTSALSRRWRYLWTSVPHIDFDINTFYPLRKLGLHSLFTAFKDFVNWVLINGTSELQTFRLCCSDIYDHDPWTTLRWIHVATKRKVRELDLVFCPSEAFELPNCLVTCESVRILSLYLFRRVLKLPRLKGFSRLTSLELVMVELSHEGLVRNFFSNCPVLKSLALISCLLSKLKVLDISCSNLKFLTIRNLDLSDTQYDEDGLLLYNEDGLCKSELKVSCPNLLSFNCLGPIALDYSLQNLSSLDYGFVHLLEEGPSHEEYRMCKILSGLCNVMFLKLSVVCLEELYSELGKPKCFCTTFYNLKSLRLCAGVDERYMEVIIHLLKCFPNLQDLFIVFIETVEWNEPFQLQDEAISCLANHLSFVDLIDCPGKEENDIELVRFLLKNGLVLENLFITWDSYPENPKEIKRKIRGFPRSSSNVKVTFLRPRKKSEEDFLLL